MFNKKEAKHTGRLALALTVVLVGLLLPRTLTGQARLDSSEFRFRPDLSIRTNLLLDGIAAPNVGFDVAVSDHWTLGASFALKAWPRWFVWDWDSDKASHWRFFSIEPEVRWWRTQPFDGWFAGADLLYTHFNVGDVHFPFGLYPKVRDYRLQGDYAGAGLFAGYSWRLGRHWRLEALAGMHFGYSRAGRYECAHCGARLGTDRGFALVPKLGLNLAWGPSPRKQDSRREEVLALLEPEAPEEPSPVFEPEEPATPQQPQEETPTFREEAGTPAVNPIFAHPIVQRSEDYVPYTKDRVLRKERGALPVYFEFDKAEIKDRFTYGGHTRDNASVLEEILAVTELVLSDTTLHISCIQIVGLASVEGSARHNQKLSERRARALKRYIQDRLPVPDDRFETVGGSEAWTELRDMMQDLLADEEAAREAGLSREEIEEIVSIIDEEADTDRREARLKALSGGKVYRVLSSRMLQDLRNSGYIRVYVDN